MNSAGINITAYYYTFIKDAVKHCLPNKHVKTMKISIIKYKHDRFVIMMKDANVCVTTYIVGIYCNELVQNVLNVFALT